MSKWITRSVLTISTVLLVRTAFTYEYGPPANTTGATGEANCNQRGCHTGNALNAQGGSIVLTGVPDSYVPGATYPLGVQVSKTGQSRWGFELTAKLANGSRGGEITATQTDFTQVVNTQLQKPTATTPQYIEQTTNGTFAGQKDQGPVWNFNWTAPAAGSGTVTFNAAGNAANDNNNTNGDFIYTTQAASAEGSATPPVVYGDLNGDGKVNVQDATLALRIAVGLIQPSAAQLKSGDVAPVPGTGPSAGQAFGDGKINVSDVTRILRYSVGLITQFP